MSEFSETSKIRANQLSNYMIGVASGLSGASLAVENNIVGERFIPKDILLAFDLLMESSIEMPYIKVASNKLFNLLYKSLSEYKAIEVDHNLFLHYLTKDNAHVLNLLNDCKPYIKKLNNSIHQDAIDKLITKFVEIEKFVEHYAVIQNIVFPVLEKHWKNHQCVKLMWSFHDDIKRNIALTIEHLKADSFDLEQFNKISSAVFFNLHSIAFREEKVLFPVMLETLDTDIFTQMLWELGQMKLPFIDVPKEQHHVDKSKLFESKIKFKTGELTVAQAEMVFNLLPVDLTYVDENDEVRFFSNPPHRIFPRTAAIVGRKVQNCHPPESVDIVNKIIASFKSGEKNMASFWLHLGPKYVMINYYAMRNEQNEYKGVLEVSQEISEIQKIEGDRKLLDW
jgi:DUF438 domain-containing protein